MQNAAVYIRVSTEDQMEYSPEAEKRALLDYAVKNDLFVDPEHIYIDEGISGRRADKRPAFQKMIASAKSKPKPFDVILVHKFDRFARNREDSIVYKSMLMRECGVKVISMTEDIGDDKTAVILEAMLEAMAEYYSLNLSEEVKKGMTEKARRGGFQTRPIYGYKADKANNILVIVPEEAEIIKMIYTDFLNLVSIGQIRNKLIAMGIKTRDGVTFEHKNIAYILNNPVYAGFLKWNPSGSAGNMHIDFNHPDSIIAKAKHEPIISEEQYNEARKLYNMRLTKLARRNIYPKYWLIGFVKCSACGKNLTHITEKNRTPRLQCQWFMKKNCNVSHSIIIPKLEAALKQVIQDDIGKDNIVYEKTEQKKSTVNFELFISKARQKLDRANEAYLSGVYDIEYFKKVKTEIDGEIALLTEQKNNSEKNEKSNKKDISKIAKNALRMFDENLSYEEKRNIAMMTIDKIIFNKPENKIILYYISDEKG